MFRRFLQLFEEYLTLKHREIKQMSALTDSITNLGTQVGSLTATVAALPAPVDESAAAGAIDAQSAAVAQAVTDLKAKFGV